MAHFKPAVTNIVHGATAPKAPPATIGEHGRKLWNDITSEWDLDSAADLAILAEACAARDRAERMRLLILEQGEMIATGTGSSKPHGCIALELQARALCSRLISKLRLRDEEVRRPGRPATKTVSPLLALKR